MLIPVPVGPYVNAEDFAVVSENRYLFVWSYRSYFFGVVFFVVAITSFVSWMSGSLARVIMWPGAAVVAGGAFSYALGSAFYYHHGYWGSLDLEGQSMEMVKAYVDNIRFDTKYVTCFIRFGRLFSGFGIVLLSIGILKWKPVSPCLGWLGILVGMAAIAIVMPSGDAFWVYKFVFHLQTLWLALMGWAVFSKGVQVEKA